jgi:predicted AAA+ superfamily ATPase
VRWYQDYIETLVQRDVRESARISSLDALPRLLAYAAAQTGRLLNAASPKADRMLSGQLLETFGFHELRHVASGHPDRGR